MFHDERLNIDSIVVFVLQIVKSFNIRSLWNSSTPSDCSYESRSYNKTRHTLAWKSARSICIGFTDSHLLCILKLCERLANERRRKSDKWTILFNFMFVSLATTVYNWLYGFFDFFLLFLFLFFLSFVKKMTHDKSLTGRW